MASRASPYFSSTPLESPRGVSRRQSTTTSTAPNGTTSLKTVVKEKDTCESDLHRQVHTDIHGSTAGMVPAPVVTATPALATPMTHSNKSSAWGWLAMAILFLILFFVFWWVVFMTFQVSWIKGDNGEVSYTRLGLSALVGSFITVVIIGIIAALVRRKC